MFFMAKLTALEKSRRLSEMRDRLAEDVKSNNSNEQRIRAADISLRLSKSIGDLDYSRTIYSVYTVRGNWHEICSLSQSFD